MTWTGLKDVVLGNDRVALRRLRLGDRDALARIAFDEAIWRYFVARVDTPADLDAFVETAVADTVHGTRAVFVVTDRDDGAIVGSTAYGNIVPAERRIEIGWTWVGMAARRTGVNRAAKTALLDYAFDVLGCERVEFKTDVLNETARVALATLGAREEGVLRSFNYMPGGRRRDVVYYSVLRAEWPALRSDRFGSLVVSAPVEEKADECVPTT